MNGGPVQLSNEPVRVAKNVFIRDIPPDPMMVALTSHHKRCSLSKITINMTTDRLCVTPQSLISGPPDQHT